GAANGYDAMLKSSLAGLICAGALAALGRALPFGELFDAGLKGAALLFDALVVLFLAWSLGAGINALDAAGYLIGALQSSLAPELLPTLVFLLCAAISFATGTSFGTMAIVMPLVVPLSFAITDDPLIPLVASGAVLSGACWGDHCSPISDTTVLSSVGTRCDLMAHVRTQLPYALVVGVISVFFGTLPAGYGVSPWLLLPLGAVACALTVRLLGKTAAPTP
ncbi:Na+/H+ antiporter NhaC family protein, partial [Myxococcota bacterium]|nr:Na+/H+ antiporter NhaC family protein [Myxococcota bacterium]